MGWGVARNWGEVSIRLSQAPPLLLAAAIAAHLAFLVFVGLCYHNSLRLAGAKVRARASLSVYLASQLGKYFPGPVVYVAGQIGLAKWLGVSVGKSVIGFTAHHIQLTATALLLAAPLLGVAWGRTATVAMVVAGLLGFLVLATGVWVPPLNALQRRRGKPQLEKFSPAPAFAAMFSGAASWIFYGGCGAILTLALVPECSLPGAAQVGMAAVAAWLIGFLSFITPAGVGVREATFVLMVRGVIPEPTAMAMALIMRLIYTGLQIPIGALTLGYLMRRQAAEAPTS
ncbi:MAG: hypothetical protein A2V63_12665 [Candidatus Eisenbacteria bacterium RBG_19FT_COMBO_70_11]|nr:MAG: hypothetical protein A2V63_12665 [Candidatus Eisenbacteria bacterium RBG_19FT_COMBO_70_11]